MTATRGASHHPLMTLPVIAHADVRSSKPDGRPESRRPGHADHVVAYTHEDFADAAAPTTSSSTYSVVLRSDDFGAPRPHAAVW